MKDEAMMTDSTKLLEELHQAGNSGTSRKYFLLASLNERRLVRTAKKKTLFLLYCTKKKKKKKKKSVARRIRSQS